MRWIRNLLEKAFKVLVNHKFACFFHASECPSEFLMLGKIDELVPLLVIKDVKK